MNSIIIMGRLTDNPELRKTPNDISVIRSLRSPWPLTVPIAAALTARPTSSTAQLGEALRNLYPSISPRVR